MIGGFLQHKLWLLKYYNTEELGIPVGIEMLAEIANEPFIIETQSNITRDYLVFKEIKIGNYFTNYQISDIDNPDDDSIYYIYRENDEVKGVFVLGINNESLFESLIVQAKVSDYYWDNFYDQQLEEKIRYNEIDRQAILKKYQVKDDLSFYRFIATNVKRKSNIFTPDEEIIENYVIRYWAQYFSSGIAQPLQLITGDYTGFVMKNEHTVDVCIIKNNKHYVFGFWRLGELDNLTLIHEIMNTVIIE